MFDLPYFFREMMLEPIIYNKRKTKYKNNSTYNKYIKPISLYQISHISVSSICYLHINFFGKLSVIKTIAFFQHSLETNNNSVSVNSAHQKNQILSMAEKQHIKVGQHNNALQNARREDCFNHKNIKEIQRVDPLISSNVLEERERIREPLNQPVKELLPEWFNNVGHCHG